MRSRPFSMVLLMGLLAAACTGESGGTASSTLPPPTTLTTMATTTSSSFPDPTTTTSVATTTTLAPAATVTSGGQLPGEPIDFGPAEGDTVAVIGVAHDDVLNLRAAPGADQPILEEIPPTFAALSALGETRELPGSFWIGVDFRDTTGWVNLRYVGYLGATDDATHTLTEEQVPTAETMLDLGFIVADAVASTDPPSEIVLVVAPSVGDLGEVTYDVIGLGDDALRGLRVHVFGQPTDEGFALDAAELTSLCGRGVDAERRCV